MGPRLESAQGRVSQDPRLLRTEHSKLEMRAVCGLDSRQVSLKVSAITTPSTPSLQCHDRSHADMQCSPVSMRPWPPPTQPANGDQQPPACQGPPKVLGRPREHKTIHSAYQNLSPHTVRFTHSNSPSQASTILQPAPLLIITEAQSLLATQVSKPATSILLSSDRHVSPTWPSELNQTGQYMYVCAHYFCVLMCW